MKHNILKKLFILVLALCMMMAMSACGKDEPETPDGDTLPVAGDDVDGGEEDAGRTRDNR